MRAPAQGSRAVIAAVILAAPGVAIAGEPVEATIQWSAPPECPDGAAVRQDVERLLARPLERAGARIRVRGEVTRDAGAAGPYRLDLTIVLGAGQPRERRLDGETCAQVTGAAAVVVALAIDDEGPARRAELHPASAQVQPPEPAEVPPPDIIVTPSVAPPASSRREWDIGAIGGVDAKSLPAAAAGLGLSAAVDLGADRIELGATAWLRRRATLASLPSVGADVSLYAAVLRYCRWLVRRTVDLGTCGGIEVGALVVTGVGVLSPSSGPERWLAPQIGVLGAVRPASRLALSVAIDGLAPIFRDQFVIVGAGEVYRPPSVTVRAVLGAHARFP
jgi:hypothetical protein